MIELTILITAVTILILLYRELRDKKQNYPYELEIEAALLPYVYRAIMFAYKSSESRMDEFQDRLSAVPKKQLAVKLYSLLPETILVGKWRVSIHFVKSVVSEKRFAQLIDTAFMGFGDWYDGIWDGYSEKLLELINANGHVDTDC